MTLNLLPIAMRATAILGCNKPILYYKYLSQTINEIGLEEPRYDEPLTYIASVQAVSNKLYEQMGLDLTKNYKTVYCPELVRSLAEQDQPDKIYYNDFWFEVVENQNWWETNGFTKFIMVEIKRDRPADENDDQDKDDNSENDDQN